MLKRASILGGVVALAAMAIGCSGSSSTSDLQTAPKPRPPYASLNLTLGTTTTTENQRQLFLDPGSTQYPKTWPVVVANHLDNQAIKLWRYDFIEPARADGKQWYATLLVRVDNVAMSSYVSFFGRGGSYPANATDLDPVTVFSGDVPETTANKRPTAFYLFLREGAPVRLVDPTVTGRTAPYRNFSDTSMVTVNLPGLDWPVGGVTLSTTAGVASEVGNAGSVTDMGVGSDGKPVDGIGTAVTIVQSERIPTTTRVSPATSEFDLCFAWQDPSIGVTLTHGVYADPTTSGGSFTSGEVGMTGGGYFLTMLPGAPSISEGRNPLNWSILRSLTDSVWALGWSADVTATGGVALGQGGEAVTQPPAGSGLISAQARAFLAGLMHPSAKATMFIGAQDHDVQGKGAAVLLEGSYVPLIARSPRAVISAHMSQLVVGGRTLWYRKNQTILGADVLNSDQTLVDRYGTMLTFSAYLPTKQ